MTDMFLGCPSIPLGPAVQAENLATRVGHVAGASQDTKKAVVFGGKSTIP